MQPWVVLIHELHLARLVQHIGRLHGLYVVNVDEQFLLLVFPWPIQLSLVFLEMQLLVDLLDVVHDDVSVGLGRLLDVERLHVVIQAR